MEQTTTTTISGLPLPLYFNTYEPNVKKNIEDYLNQLNSHERQIYLIAHTHLKTSFNIVKSNGYISWLKTK